MSEQKQAQEHAGRHSRLADAAATRWAEAHPEDDVPHWPPSHVPEVSRLVVPDHHSASAEAAALRWFEQHEDEDF